MPKVIRKNAAAKTTTAKAKPKPAPAANTKTRRTAEDVDALVPEFVAHLSGGGKMKALKEQYGFTDDGPIRSALYRAGYDSKGEPHGVEEGDLSALKGAKLSARLVAERNSGAPWYALAYRAGLKEGEVKKIVADNGGVAEGRVYIRTEKPAKPAKQPVKAAAKPVAAKPGKVARRGKTKAAAADPS